MHQHPQPYPQSQMPQSQMPPPPLQQSQMPPPSLRQSQQLPPPSLQQSQQLPPPSLQQSQRSPPIPHSSGSMQPPVPKSYFRNELFRFNSPNLTDYAMKMCDPKFGDHRKFDIPPPQTDNPDDKFFYEVFLALSRKGAEKTAEGAYDGLLQHYSILPQGRSHKGAPTQELRLYDAFFDLANAKNKIIPDLAINGLASPIVVDATRALVSRHLSFIPQNPYYFGVTFTHDSAPFDAEGALRSCCPGDFYACFCCLGSLRKHVYSVVTDRAQYPAFRDRLEKLGCAIKEFNNLLCFALHFQPNDNWVNFLRDLRGTVPPLWMSVYDNGPNGVDVNIVYSQEGMDSLTRKKIYDYFATVARPVGNPNNFVTVGRRVPISAFVQGPEKSTDPCPEGNGCVIIDSNHSELYDHPHRHGADVCTNIYCGNINCRNNKTHICPNGSRCQHINDPRHCSTTIHIRDTCPNGVGCGNPDARHRMACHGMVVGFCDNPSCAQAHGNELIHVPELMPKCTFDAALHRRDGVDFDSNVGNWMKRARESVGKVNETSFGEIVSWFRNMRPVIQCSVAKFNSILKLRTFASFSAFASAFRNTGLIVDMFFMNPENIRNYGGVGLAEREYLTLSLRKHIAGNLGEFISRMCEEERGEDKIRLANDVLNDDLRVFRDDESLKKAENKCRNSPNINTIEREIKGFVVDMLDVFKTIEPGDDSMGDPELGTDSSVLAVLGANMCDSSSDEVSIILKPSILYHPDTSLTPVPSAWYKQGKHTHNPDCGLERDWMGAGAEWDRGGRKDYNEAMFHTSANGWAEACAYEWVARTAKELKKPPASITSKDVADYWKDAQNSALIEARLPSMFSLGYIEGIFLKSSVTGDIKKGDTEFLKNMAAAGMRISEVPDTREETFTTMCKIGVIPQWKFPASFSFSIPNASNPGPLPRALSPKARVSFDTVSLNAELLVSLLLYPRDGKVPMVRVLLYRKEDSTGCVECRDFKSDRTIAASQFSAFMNGSRLEPFTMLANNRRFIVYHSDFAFGFNKNFIKFELPAECAYVGIRAENGVPYTAWNFVISNDDPEACDDRFGYFDYLDNLYNPQVQPIQPQPQPVPNQLQPNGSQAQLVLNQLKPNGSQAQFNPNQPPPQFNPSQAQFNPNQLPPNPNQLPPNANQLPPNANQLPHNGSQLPHNGSQLPQAQFNANQPPPQFNANQLPQAQFNPNQPPPQLNPNQPQPPQKKQNINYCKDKWNCKHKRDPAHCAQFVHICINGDNCRGKDDPTHLKQFVHVCLYGNSCTNNDPKHREVFLHLKKPNCPEKDCKDLENPRHRAEFHHPKMWDFMIECQNGPGCSSCNGRNRLKYQHSSNPVYPELP